MIKTYSNKEKADAFEYIMQNYENPMATTIKALTNGGFDGNLKIESALNGMSVEEVMTVFKGIYKNLGEMGLIK